MNPTIYVVKKYSNVSVLHKPVIAVDRNASACGLLWNGKLISADTNRTVEYRAKCRRCF